MLRAASVLALLACVSACASATTTFPPREPLARDPDRRPFRGELEVYETSEAWDYLDKSYLWPVSRLLAVEPAGEAANVSTLDEVPSSSWFENRVASLTPEAAALGPCDQAELQLESTRVVAGKPNGMYPGFLVKDAAGQRYMLKIDAGFQGPRNSSSDVVGSRIYHAAGYHVPCNRAVRVERSELIVDPKAEVKQGNGVERRLVDADVDQILERGMRLPDGSWRAAASRYLEGKPLGPWRYEATWEGDRNDIVPHEDRRELRGARLLAAWTNHWDSREQNTLAMWIETAKGQGYVRHHLLDFGDCFGTFSGTNAYAVRRRGQVHWFSPTQIAADFMTFGLVERPWDSGQLGPTGSFLGYYDVERFDPESWSPTYPNPAFERMTERDAAWMARIIAQLDEAKLRAIVGAAKLDARLADEWVKVLLGRRHKILARYLTRLSPLALPAVVPNTGGVDLCVRDLAFDAGIARHRRYRARSWWKGSVGSPTPFALAIRLDQQGRLCVPLPSTSLLEPARPAYLIIEITSETEPARTPLARFHLYQRGQLDYLLAGVERPERD